MRIAFYAPMKPPTHPVPSGDRRMARQIVQALQHCGHTVDLASALRSHTREPDTQKIQRVRRDCETEADRLIRSYRQQPARTPTAWVTYHHYYKAVDWIGPQVASALSIPYLIVEPSHAPKRMTGPWSTSARAALQRLLLADRVLPTTALDHRNLAKVIPPDRLVRFPPFLHPIAAAPARTARKPGSPARLLAVGMMRPGDKLESYRVLSSALALLIDRPWSLTIVGDGPARVDVEAAFAPVIAAAPGRVRWLGERAQTDLPEIYAAADLFCWPGVGEAYGMSYLEASASALPIVAQAIRGVPDVVIDGRTGRLTPEQDTPAFARAIADLLDDPATGMTLGMSGRRFVENERSLDRAAAVLDSALAGALNDHA